MLGFNVLFLVVPVYAVSLTLLFWLLLYGPVLLEHPKVLLSPDILLSFVVCGFLIGYAWTSEVDRRSQDPIERPVLLGGVVYESLQARVASAIRWFTVFVLFLNGKRWNFEEAGIRRGRGAIRIHTLVLRVGHPQAWPVVAIRDVGLEHDMVLILPVPNQHPRLLLDPKFGPKAVHHLSSLV